jgi:hypothetical protein
MYHCHACVAVRLCAECRVLLTAQHITPMHRPMHRRHRRLCVLLHCADCADRSADCASWGTEFCGPEWAFGEARQSVRDYWCPKMCGVCNNGSNNNNNNNGNGGNNTGGEWAPTYLWWACVVHMVCSVRAVQPCCWPAAPCAAAAHRGPPSTHGPPV